MMVRTFCLAMVVVGLISGCAPKPNISASKSYAMHFKTPQLAFAEAGFINTAKDFINLQVFSGATPILNLQITDTVCENGLCSDKEAFNRRFFGHPHYPALINDLLGLQPIYSTQGIKKGEDGFVQEIQGDGYAITYEVNSKGMIFKERVQGIIIRLRPLEE